MYGYLTGKCFNLNTRKVQANFHLVDAQEVDHLQSFNQSMSAIQSFIADCPSISNTNDSYNDSNDSFFMCEIQDQVATSSPKRRLCVDLHVMTSFFNQTFVHMV